MSTIKELSEIHNWNLPTVCPVCGSSLDLSPNHMHLTCTNEFCSSRMSGTIAKWCSVHGIKEMGLTTIEKIQERGFCSSISAMYVQIDNPGSECHRVMGSELGKNWLNIVNEINTHREMSLAKFIAGYNIPGIGEKQVQKVIDFYSVKDFNGLFWSDSSQRFVCDGIGSVLSQKLSKGLEMNKADMLETIKHISFVKQDSVKGILNGMSFCFTGAMEYKRKDLQDMVLANGGTNLDSVTKNLTYLVCENLDTKSNKYKNAIKYNVKCITLKEFMQLLKC